MTVYAAVAAVTFSATSSAPTPLYHFYQQDWGLSPAIVTVIFAAYAFAMLASFLTVARLSDYVGRKPMILAALLLNAAALLLFITAGNAAELILARILQGLGTGIAMHVLRENEVSSYASACPNPVPAGDAEYCMALRDATSSNVQGYTIGAGVGYALGGAALVTGVLLLWVLPKPADDAPATTATIDCAPTFGSVLGASCAGTF